MSPTTRTKRTARKPVRRTTKTATRAPRKKIAAAPPSQWSAEIRDVNVVWYNTTDFERAKKFYTEVLGLPVAYDVSEAGWIEFGYPNQTHLALNLWRDLPTKPPAIGGATATFTCDDVRAALARLQAKGVKCDPVDETPSVILGAFYDPDGNRLQLAQTLNR